MAKHGFTMFKNIKTRVRKVQHEGYLGKFSNVQKITSAIFLLQFVFSSMAKHLTKLPKWDYLIKNS